MTNLFGTVGASERNIAELKKATVLKRDIQYISRAKKYRKINKNTKLAETTIYERLKVFGNKVRYKVEKTQKIEKKSMFDGLFTKVLK